ncbi:MAG: hypothetical protein JNK07_17590 [Alphaproteobacteria bacterium]|nr:hypothetical protein [Alphaproteobacteria bacterium]
MTALMNVLALALLIAVIGGAVAVISMLSVARTVAIHKHSEWPFDATFNFVYARGMLGLAVTVLLIAGIWLTPLIVPDILPHNELRMTQAIATLAIIVMTNIHYYAVVIEKIRRPPK